MREVPARFGFGHQFKHFVAGLTAMAAAGLLAGPALGQTYEVLHAFSAEAGNPLATLLRGSDGRLYGTAYLGGYFGLGSIFVLTPDGVGGFTFTNLHSFRGDDGAEPYAGLIQGADGAFYGTTGGGGPGAPPTAFRMDASGDVTVLHVFAADEGPAFYTSLLQASDGFFYGVKEIGGSNYNGAIFKMDAVGNVTTVHAFDGTDGSRPSGLIEGPGGKLYGTTQGGGTGGFGTVFKMDLTGNVTTLHSFSGGDGSYPYAPLVRAADGSFWGTTTQGGEFGYGTVFRMDTAGNVSALHSFDSGEALYPNAPLLQGWDGMFYGTSVAGGAVGVGSVFRVDSAGNLAVLHSFALEDGFSPYGGLIQDGTGTFYGTTARGGGPSQWNPGTVFKMDGAGNVTTLHSFVTTGGSAPFGPLVRTADGSLYGTTNGGGTSSSGIVYRLDPSGLFTSLHSFDARVPPGLFLAATSSLMQGADGDFYGTTRYGLGSYGTIFRMDASGTVTTLHAFTGDDGGSPSGPLVQTKGGSLYGVTEADTRSPYSAGGSFRIEPSGAFSTLHFFSGEDGGGYHAFAGLLRASDGAFYGTTLRGGASGRGVVFRMSASGDVTTLHSFDGSDGSIPGAPLIQARDGDFYGETFGSIFRMDAAGHVTTLQQFTPDEVVFGLFSGLLQGADDRFYGTTPSGGEHGSGTVFRIDSCGNLMTLHSFDGRDGSYPNGALIQSPDGSLYGPAASGGPARGGVLFRLTLGSQPVAPGPAQIWLGLKNGDDVGTNFDLKAEILRNGCTVVGSGEIENVPGSSSAFGNAIQRVINLAVPDPLKASLSPGDTLGIRLSVRAGATGHRSGSARLWFNDAAAKSRFDVTIGGATTTLYLLDGFRLGTSFGSGPKKTIDVFVDRAAGGNPWKPFGTWSRTY